MTCDSKINFFRGSDFNLRFYDFPFRFCNFSEGDVFFVLCCILKAHNKSKHKAKHYNHKHVILKVHSKTKHKINPYKHKHAIPDGD